MGTQKLIFFSNFNRPPDSIISKISKTIVNKSSSDVDCSMETEEYVDASEQGDNIIYDKDMEEVLKAPVGTQHLV